MQQSLVSQKSSEGNASNRRQWLWLIYSNDTEKMNNWILDWVMWRSLVTLSRAEKYIKFGLQVESVFGKVLCNFSLSENNPHNFSLEKVGPFDVSCINVFVYSQEKFSAVFSNPSIPSRWLHQRISLFKDVMCGIVSLGVGDSPLSSHWYHSRDGMGFFPSTVLRILVLDFPTLTTSWPQCT